MERNDRNHDDVLPRSPLCFGSQTSHENRFLELGFKAKLNKIFTIFMICKLEAILIDKNFN